MILFIFEGEKREVQIHKTIQYLFFNNNQPHILSYCNNIYDLYKKMKKHSDDFNGIGADIVKILKEIEKNNESKTLHNIENSDAFSEIYLFFDYDIKRQDKHNHETVEEQNKYIEEILNYFDNETENGKLYINYPMIESIRYFKRALPDKEYYLYTVDLFIGKRFKKQADDDSFYKNLDFICFKFNRKKSEITVPKDQEEVDNIKKNWEHVKELNISKANYICSGNNIIPTKKSSINQIAIFKNQIIKYIIPHKKIAILNAFPLFLYDYTR